MFGFTNSPAPLMTVQDGVTAEAWGKSSTEWIALTDEERRDLRYRVVYAPNFHTVNAFSRLYEVAR